MQHADVDNTMTTGTNHDEYEDLLPGYALDALDAEDWQRVAAHLEACPACRSELADLAEVAGLLALLAPPATPPARVKEALFARLAAPELPARPVTPLTAIGGAGTTPPARPAGDGAGRRVRVALAALAAAVALALGGWNVALQQRNAELAARVEEQALVVRLLNDPRAAHSLTGSADPYTAGGPAGYIYADPGSNVALILTYYLPQLPPDQAYQLWLVAPDGTRDSGGLFRPDANGSAQFLVRAPAPFAKYRAVGVTVEPAGGSPGPTSPRVIGGNLQ